MSSPEFTLPVPFIQTEGPLEKTGGGNKNNGDDEGIGLNDLISRAEEVGVTAEEIMRAQNLLDSEFGGPLENM